MSSKCLLLHLSILLFLSSCNSTDEMMESVRERSGYILKHEDGTEIDIRKDLYQGEGPNSYNYGLETNYELTLLNTPAFLYKLSNGMSFTNYSRLVSVYSTDSFTYGDKLFVLIAFGGISAGEDGKSNLMGSFLLKDSHNKTVATKSDVVVHRQKLLTRRAMLGGSESPFVIEIDDKLKEGTYTLEAIIRDLVYGIEVPLKKTFTILSDESARKNRFGEKYNSGWEGIEKNYRLFVSQQQEVVEYLSKPHPNQEFYDYGVKAQSDVIIPGHNLFVAVAYSTAAVDEYQDKCNVAANFYFYSPEGKTLLEVRDAPVCADIVPNPSTSTLGLRHIAFALSSNLAKGEYLVVAHIFDSNSGESHDLGQKLVVR